MVQRGKSFLETKKNLMKAAREAKLPGSTDTEEVSTDENNPIQQNTEDGRKKKVGNFINEAGGDLINSKAGQGLINASNKLQDIVSGNISEESKEKIGNTADKIVNSKVGQKLINFANNVPNSKLGKLVDEATNTENAEQVKETAQAAVEGVQGTQEERDALLGEDAELKKEYRFLRGAASIAKNTPIIKRLRSSKKFVQAWEDFEKSTYLSDGTVIIKEPTLEKVDGLKNTKNLAASILNAYLTKGKVVDAKTIKEKMDGFDDVSDAVLNKFIGGVIYAHIHNQPIDRDYVSNKYGELTKSEGFLTEKQAIVDLFSDDNTWAYGTDETMMNYLESDPELMKVIEAYKRIGAYADFLENNGYNQYGSTARGLAESYKDEGFESEGGMSLKEAYEIASKYDSKKLQNFIKQLSYNLQKTEKYQQRRRDSAEEYEGRWNARKQIMDVFKGTNALLSDFAEYNVEGRSESGIAKYSPLGLADLRVSGNTFTDEDGNIRNRNGKAIYMRQSDGSYVNQKGENVTKMLREHKGLLKNIGQHLEGIGTGIGQTMEGAALAQATADKEGTRAGMEYELEVVAGLTQTAFDSVLLANPHFLMLESTPVVGKGIELTFGALSELGASITLGALQIANLENNMDPVNVEAAKQIGGLISTMAVMRKFEKTVGPYKKAFIEAKNKAFSRYRDRIVEIMGKEELNNKIKKKALEDKSKEPTIIDGEKTVDELRGELGKERVEGKKGTEGKTENAEVKQEVVKQEAPSEEKVTINKPTEENTIDMTSTKDKLGYAFQVNKAVMSQMIKEFREEYKKNLDKYLPKDSTARAIFDIGEKSTDITIKESAQRALGDIGLSFKEMAKNIADGLKNIRGKAKTLPKKVSDKVTKTRQKDAYEKMELSTEERDTIQNNSKIGKLGRILQRLVSTKRGKVIKNMNINTPGEVKTLVKDTVVKDRIKEQLEAGVKRLQEWKKEIHEKFYQAMSQIKNIDFKDFFLGEDGIKKSLKELIRDSDAGTYVKFREEDGKIVVEFKKGYSQYYYEHVKPTIEKIVKEYNDIVENGKISEQNISNIADLMKDLRDEGEAMYKEGVRTQNAQKIKEGTAIMNAGKNMLGSLKSYLEQKGVAENFLLGEKVTAAKGDIDAEFKDFMTDGKIDEAKVKSFFEDLSKKKLAGEDIANDPRVKALEALKIDVQEYADLYRNGSTALEKIYKTQLSLKEFESEFGKFFKKTGQVKRSGLGKFGTLIGGVLFRNTIGKILAGIGALGILASPIDKVLEKLSNSVYQKNLRNALNDALKDPKNAKQIENILEGLNDTVKEIDRRLNAVIDKMAKKGEEAVEPEQPKALPNKPNRKEYDTSHPNREEYDESNAEPKDVTSETQAEWMPGDADMVVGEKEALPGAEKHELPDRRLALREDPEGDLQESMNDLEVQVTDALRQLMEMINDSKKGGDEPTTPTGPEGPDGGDNGGDNGGGGDTIDDFLKLIEGDAPEQGEGRPDFKNRSNESLNKLIDKDGNIKEGVPEEYRQEILDELSRREVKKQTDDSEVRTQNNIIRAILKQLDQIAEGKAEDNIREKYNEQVMQAWNVDTNRADEIIGDIVDGRLTEQNVYQDKTKYEDNQEASEWIQKRTGKETKTTKSASKTSSLEVRDTKPDSEGKLNALKTQLEQKKKALPKIKSAKTLQKKQAEIDKLEKEITRIEEALNARELDEMDVEAQKVIDESIAEEEKPQVQPSEEKISEPQEEQMDEISTLMTFNPENATAEEIKKAQIALTKKKNEGDLGIYKKNEVERKINELNEARIGKEDNLLFSIAPKETKNGNTDIKAILDEANRLAKENKTNTESEYNKLMIREAMIDPVDFVQKNNKTPNMITYSRIANMFNRFNEQTAETQEKFMNIFREKAKENNLYSKDRYADKNGLLVTLEDTINEMGEVEGREESYETFTGKPMKKNYSERDYNGEKKYIRTDFGISYGQDRINDPVTAKTMRKVAMDVRDISYILDLDMAKIIKEESKLLSERPSEREPMKSNRVGELKVNPTRGQTKSDALGYYDENKNTVATNTMKHTTAHEYFHQITEMERRIRESGRRSSQGLGNQKFYDKVEKNDKIMNGMINGDKISKEYYNSPTEYTSRMMEMYLADKQGGKEMVESMFGDVDGYRPREIYEKEIKPLVEKDLLEPLRKKYGRNPDRTERETYDELIESGYYD